MSNLRLKSLTVIVLGFVFGLHAAQAQPPQEGASDLDKLLRLLGYGGVVNNEWLPGGVSVESTKEGEQAWLKAIEKLGTSRSREVVEAVKQLKPVMDNMNATSEYEKKTKELNAELRRKHGLGEGELLTAAANALHGPDAFDLDELVRKKKLTREQADEYSRQSGELTRRFFQGEAATLNNSMAMKQRGHRMRKRNEVLRSRVVHDVLRPALQARAGQDQKSPPLDVRVALVPASDTWVQYFGTEVRVSLHSRSSQELTQLTLLLEIQTSAGSRYASIFIPKLPALGCGHFAPISLTTQILTDRPQDVKTTELTVQRVRYDVWCNQFRSEGREPTMLSPAEMINDVRLQALHPGLTYPSQGGTRPQMSHKEFMEAEVKPQPELSRRFELVFKKLAPKKQDFEVELDLIDHQATGKEKTTTKRFRGVLTLPTAKPGADSPEKVVLNVRSGDEDMQLTLNEIDNRAEWRALRGPASGRQFIPDQDVPRAGSPEALAQAQYRAAQDLAFGRKYAEAKLAYEKILKDFPETIWANQAKMGIDGMDALKEGHQRVDAMKKAQDEELRKRTGLSADELAKAVEEGKKQKKTAREVVAEKVAQAQQGKSNSKNAPTERPSRPPAQPSRGGSTPASIPDRAEESVTSVTVDDVEYVYQGAVRNGGNVNVTVLVTSQQGDRDAPNGTMTLIDQEGRSYSGKLLGGPGPRAKLREGKPVKLTWQFGGNNAFTGGKLAIPPVSKDARFTRILIVGTQGSFMEFRNVSADMKKSKGQ